MEFYKIQEKDKVSALTFIEAAEIYRAESSEPPYHLPDSHYTQVQIALDAFEKDFLGATSETITTTEKSDAISAQAKKFLRDIKSITKNGDVKSACENMIISVERGEHTPLPNEIKKIRQQLEKRQITYGQLDNLILMIAKKYDALDSNENSDIQQINLKIQPEVVLSETFID
jgi:hypothetical protein